MKLATETKLSRTSIGLNRDALEPLVRHEKGIAISLYMPVQFYTKNDAHEDAVRFGRLLRSAEGQLLAQGVEKSHAQSLLRPAENLVARGTLAVKAPGMAVFVAEDFFRMFELSAEVTEHVTVGSHFEIKPLLGLIEAQTFYVLALSQKHIRLLRVAPDGLHEVEVHGAPENLFAAFEEEHFERQMQFHTASLANTDATRISHGGSREMKDRITEFLRKVDRGVNSTIHDRTSPLLLAGVNYIFPLYHEVSTYPTLLPEAIPGSPDHLSAKEFLDAGRAAIRRHLQAEDYVHFANYRQLKGTPQASSNTRDIVASADRGRVLFLFIPNGVSQWGRVDAIGDVHIHAEQEQRDEELVNRAATKTLAGGGHVCVLPASEFDEGVCMAAVFRY